MTQKRKIFIFVSIIAGLGLILGLLAYYQKQGFIKVFPTAEDRRIKKILEIDRSKFIPPQGLSAEKFEEEIKELERRREQVLNNPRDAAAWFSFGYTKEFLNDHAGAAAAWEKSFELQPLNFVTSVNLANTYQYFLKNFSGAEYYYQKALEVKLDSTAAYLGLMDLYRFNMREKQGLFEPLVLQAIQNDPGNQVNYLSGLVEFFAIKGDIPKAKEYLVKIQQVKPEAAAELLESYPVLR